MRNGILVQAEVDQDDALNSIHISDLMHFMDGNHADALMEWAADRAQRDDVLEMIGRDYVIKYFDLEEAEAEI